MHNPFLIGEKIYLRTIEESDLTENYSGWFNDADICQFNNHHRFPYYRQNLQEYFETTIRSKNNLILAIIDRETDKHIGNIALENIDFINQSAELAIIIGDKDFWGKGVGKEACRLIIAHGFGDMNLHRIYCGTSMENKGMQKLAESVGFSKEGVTRHSIFKNGAFHDSVLYGLLRDQYEKTQK